LRNFALFIPIDQEAAADEIMTQIYGSPQSGSFIRALSTDGNPPFTHLGAYAAGLTELQAENLSSQSTVEFIEASWTEALAQRGLVVEEA
jgi:hypothetical protein